MSHVHVSATTPPPQVRQFSAEVYEHRWGTIAFAIPQILNLEVPLRHAWNLAAFLTGVPEDKPLAEQEGGPGEAQSRLTRSVAQTCDTAISSDKFWAMCRVLEGVAGVLRHLLSWAEQCPCHHHLYPKLDMVRCVDEHFAKTLEMQWAQCPPKRKQSARTELRGVCQRGANAKYLGILT